MPSSVRPLLPRDPRTVARYELLGRIGEGGMGTVYLGRALGGGAVAVKVVRRELADDAAFVARFHSEVANAERVASFSTAQVLDHGRFEGGAFLVTEYIDGPSLGRYIAEHGALSPGLVQGVAVGVAAALVAIHGAGLIHRDLKPANVLLSLSGPRVIDFGIARALDEATRHTMTGQLVGSPGWIAPEQIHGQEVTTAVDIFTWGCLVAYAGTAEHPFGVGDFVTMAARIAQGEPDPGPLPAPLDRLVRAALVKDPRDRPSAQELLLTLVAGSSGPMAVGPAAPARPADSAGSGGPAEFAGRAVPAAPAVSGALAGPPETERERAETPAAAAGPAVDPVVERTVEDADDVGAGRAPAPSATVTVGDDAARETVADSWRPEELAPTAQAVPVTPAGVGATPAGPAMPALPHASAAASTPAATESADDTDATEPAQSESPTVALHKGRATEASALSPSDRSPYAPTAVPPVGHTGQVDQAGQARRRRRQGLLTGGAALSLVVVAVPLAWLALGGDERKPTVKPPASPAKIAEKEMLVRLDRDQGWPQQCHGNIAKVAVDPTTGAESAPKILRPGAECDILPQLSKDRTQIAFTRGNGKNGATSQLWVMNADGSGARMLDDRMAGGTRSAWSPDGKKLAYMRKSGAVSEVHTVTTTGGVQIQRLTGTGLSKDDPAWSPDGRWIAFWEDRDSVHQIVKIEASAAMTAPTGRSVPVTEEEKGAGDPVWSPGSEEIAYTASSAAGDGDIRVISADGAGESRPVTSGAAKDMDPTWSPRGDWIAFVRGDVTRPVVWAARADSGGSPQRLTVDSGLVGHPTWR